MAIKRYFADADNTITNAFQENLTTRGTGSNMGQADILETFSISSEIISGNASIPSTLCPLLSTNSFESNF